MVISTPKQVAAFFAAAAGAVSLIVAWEGYQPVGYRDIVNIATDCYGRTGGDVQVGKRTPDEKCHSELAKDVFEHALEIQPCIKADVPQPSMSAFISFSYNVGSGAFCKSTLVKRLNAGDLAGACAELSRWNKAGGKVSKGLANRRAQERALCEEGLNP